MRAVTPQEELQANAQGMATCLHGEAYAEGGAYQADRAHAHDATSSSAPFDGDVLAGS